MTIKPGALRFNTDSMKLEIFRGSANYNGSASMAGIGTLAAGQWEEIQATSAEVQTGGTRALLTGGYHPSNQYLDEIVFFNMATTGNSETFGELTIGDRNHVHANLSDRTRGISGGGSKAPGIITDDIEFVTIASTGNAAEFGDLSLARYCPGPAANSTRGIFAGGHSPANAQTHNIDYITIQASGKAQDFGDLTGPKRYIMGTFSSPTRGIFAGGANPVQTTDIDFITTSTQGNGADFGDMNVGSQDGKGSITSNAIRGIIMGGTNPGATATIEYLTLSTLGSPQDFGDLLTAGAYGAGAASPTRCVKMGQGHPSYTNVIEYVQIMTLGDSIDFGDLNTQVTGYPAGLSNGHGGL